MRNLFAFLYRYHVFFVFIFMEVFSLGIIIQNNYYHASQFSTSSNQISGEILKRFKNSVEYFSLSKTNEALAEENAKLKNKLLENNMQEYIPAGMNKYMSAKIIKNSYNKRNNYLTINKGSLHGIEKGMGVIVENSIVGIVSHVSLHFASVMSILNKKAVISTKFLKSNHFGSLMWDGKSHDFAQLYSIEKHVDVSIGDSLITNGYSNIFPEGIKVGTVNRFEEDETENFYFIEVNLNLDYSNLDYVYVIQNPLKNERTKLEKKQDE